MNLFFILGCFVLLVVYVCARTVRALELGLRGSCVLASVHAAFLTLFLAVHTTGGYWLPATARYATFAADIWIAVVFWLGCVLFLLDLLWNFPVMLGGLSWSPYRRLRLRSAPMMVLAVGLTLAACVVGLDQAASVRVVTVTVETERLIFDARPLRIVLLADLHIGRTSNPETIRHIRDLVAREKPDLLLSAGDFVDTSCPEAKAQADFFRTINPPLGKYAVLGNHECYAGEKKAVELLVSTGFFLLRNQTADLGENWSLAGVDDPVANMVVQLGDGPEKWLLAVPKKARYRILLKHRPDVSEAALTGADLQLSGHTHNGQIFPFGFFTRRAYPWPVGRLMGFRGGLDFYISPGAGTWGPPFRLFAPPEITVVEIVPKLHPDDNFFKLRK